jgi:histidyl-tRNA synthetase
VMRAFGLGPADVRVRLSDRRVLHALLLGAGVTDAQLPAAYQAVDKIERLDREALLEQLAAAGVSAAAADGLFAVAALRGLPAVEAALARVPGGAEAGRPLRRVVDALGAMRLGEFVEVDLTIVRGLAYYTGTVFELFDAGRTLRAICGGGRYDDLLQALGGVDLPALGFGMGDVVLAELLRERGLVPTDASSIDVFLAAITDEDVPEVLALAHELRDAGLRTEYALGAQSIGKQLKLADARNARFAVVVGPDDRGRGEVMVKDLSGNSQVGVGRDRVVGRLVEVVAR